MKKTFLILLLFISLSNATAQIHEFGIFVGGSNFIGDVGSTTFVKPNETAYGLIYKWNVNPRYAWRFSYMQSRITGQDIKSDELRRQKRDLMFDNHIKEFSAGFEFNFFDFNLHDFDKKLTPYVFTGVNYVIYDGLFFGNGVAKSDSSHGTVAIPIILGLKTNVLPSWVLGFEVGARYTFADDLDGSYPTNENLKNLRFGNLNSKDWYMFSGFTLTYTFGEKPCYCSY